MLADLSGLLGAARDQGRRPTCMSFALSDLHQLERSFTQPLSTDALHCQAATQTGRGPNEGVPVGALFSVLETIGQVDETSWPYGMTQASQSGATSYRAMSSSAGFDESLVLHDLQHRAVGLGLKIGREFHTADGLSAITLASSSKPLALHAVLVVGARLGASGIEFLLRNSWGSSWALNGHVWVESLYLQATTIMSFRMKAL